MFNRAFFEIQNSNPVVASQKKGLAASVRSFLKSWN